MILFFGFTRAYILPLLITSSVQLAVFLFYSYDKKIVSQVLSDWIIIASSGNICFDLILGVPIEDDLNFCLNLLCLLII